MTSSTDVPPVTLSIAGSDSGGGAGIQADVRAISWVKSHPCTAITALTAQNSTGVQDIHPVPPEFVHEQIDSITSDFDVQSTKTGMLLNSEIIERVIENRNHLGTLIVDPVMVAASGDPLMQEEAEATLVNNLLPEADLITPNIFEARIIARHLGFDENSEPVPLANEIVNTLNDPDLLLKGGHLDTEKCVDHLISPGNKSVEYPAKRQNTDNTHGSGCLLSSMIAGLCATGKSMERSIEIAKDEITRGLKNSYACGNGAGTLNFLAPDNPSDDSGC